MGTEQSSFMTSFLPIIIIFGIFYFLVMRPQQKQESQHKKMLAALSKGDKIITNGGILGTVSSVNEHDLEIEVADKIRIKILRSMVMGLQSAILQPKEAKK